MNSREIVRAELAELYRELGLRTEALAAHHRARLRCERGCSACCLDELTVFAVEADAILRSAPHPPANSRPSAHPPGACAFLDDDGACRIYAARPLVCRTQGLPLRVFVEDEDDELIERRDICPLNAEGEPLDELGEEELYTVGEFELRLQQVQRRFGAGSLDRVKLRQLFEDWADRDRE